ncbi:hypothetical protein BJ742DRAFT_814068 [Cladochytrium replicatum]|nr:hypothetical protein BJ742DRAFT_814068 [Cladochytrium replicatum]
MALPLIAFFVSTVVLPPPKLKDGTPAQSPAKPIASLPPSSSIPLPPSTQPDKTVTVPGLEDPSDPKLPPYFPLKLRRCQDQAERFFGCFEKNSIPNGDKDVARSAVVTCQQELLDYQKCMDAFVGPRAKR